MNGHLGRAAAPLLIAVVADLVGTAPAAAQEDSSLVHAMLVAEDARAPSAADLGPLLQSIESASAEIRRIAVRALGRLERESLVPAIVPLLSASSASVRREAANALAQAAGGGDPTAASAALYRRLQDERDPAVLGAIAQALGRLRYRDESSRREAERALVETSWRRVDGVSVDAPGKTLLGIARGLESLIRRGGSAYRTAAATTDRLRKLAEYGRTIGDAHADLPPEAAQIRRLAVAALASGGVVPAALLNTAMVDSDREVRRLAARASGTLDSLEGRERLIDRAFADSAAPVRYEALGAYSRRLRSTQGCGPIERALNDADPHVSLRAIDLLGEVCQTEAAIGELLYSLAQRLDPAARPWHNTWHRPAHALVALSSVTPELAAPLLSQHAEHENWLVRMYAARAASAVRDLGVLQLLAFDRHDNVRHAAVTGLHLVVGHAADSTYIAALKRPDYQLLIAAAGALEGSPRIASAVPALLGALRRVTLERRETSRDVRRALLDRLADLGGLVVSDELRPYLSDFDPLIASRVAGLLSTWLGQPHAASPEPLPSVPVPSAAELAELTRAHVTIRMRGGGTFDLRLLPGEAPTNAARFARLARTGYFDGLTFHRVVPNFVVQGGSPGANEYAGDGPYTRDELGVRSHVRGTVGLSTRGRDTGDGQLFANLVDNVRLDHNYTIFAVVTSGMDVVDGMLEGATIERVIIQ